MNPFRDTIVTSPWDNNGVDVPGIHGQILKDCLGGVETVRSHARSGGLLIHGATGAGKTHLLRRLRAGLTPLSPAASDRHECLYVWVRLQTHPSMIWRTLRKFLVNDWFRPVGHLRSQFERILFHRLAEIRVAKGDLEPWFEWIREEQPDELKALIEQIADRLDLDRDTTVAFHHLTFGRHRRSLRAWLAGESLPESELVALELTQKEESELDREEQAARVVMMLCRLAGNGLPVVLAFDQVEALQSHSRDQEALFAFGQLVSTLHDNTTNVLIISSVQTAFASDLKDHAREADYARMTSLGSLTLQPLSRQQAEELIAARLRAAEMTVPADASSPRTWPLSPTQFDSLFADHPNLSPRKLLTACAERLDVLLAGGPEQSTDKTVPSSDVAQVSSTPMTMTPAPSPIESLLKQEWETRIEAKAKSNGPTQTEEILRHGLPQAISMVVPGCRAIADSSLPEVPLLFETPAGRAGLAFCQQANMTSLASQLKKLKESGAVRKLARLTLIRDHRVPISKTAIKTQQHLQDLENDGASVAYPTVEVLATIDALRSLLSDAKSGDLDCENQPVAPQTVAEWLAGHLTAEVREFVEQVLGTASPSSSPSATELESLNQLLAETPFVPLSEASRRLNRPEAAVVELARRYPDRVQILSDPTMALFRVEPGPGSSLS